ncbi:MAG: LytTR family DNA-binding domain-containing protein, partial [Pseudomonadota bacterium]
MTSLLALADVGKTWYWFPQQIPVHVLLYGLYIWAVYASWVGIGAFVGWFRLRLAAATMTSTLAWVAHGIMSLAIGLSHLLADAAMVWWLYQPGVALRGFSTLYAEKLVAWLPYEILAYWGCLAVFALMATRRASQRGVDSAYLQRLSARQNDETIVIDAADIDCIEAMDNYVVVTANAERHVLNDTMARLEKAL